MSEEVLLATKSQSSHKLTTFRTYLSSTSTVLCFSASDTCRLNAASYVIDVDGLFGTQGKLCLQMIEGGNVKKGIAERHRLHDDGTCIEQVYTLTQASSRVLLARL